MEQPQQEWVKEDDWNWIFRVFNYYVRLKRHGVVTPVWEMSVFCEGKHITMPEVSFSNLDQAKSISVFAVFTAWQFGLKPDVERF